MKKPRRKFTKDDLQKIEAMYSYDLATEHIAALLDLSDTWYCQLLKKDAALQFAKRLGKAKASLKVKRKLWEKIELGDMRAIELYLKSKENYTTTNKMELSGPEGKPIESTEVSMEELKARVLALRKANDLTDD